MLLGALTARFRHGLLIVAAPESDDRHDDWDPASTSVHAGPDSVYVGVRDAASGLVAVECHEGTGDDGELHRMFSGELRLPSLKFIVCDPDESVRLTVLTDAVDVQMRLYGDHPDEPARVLVYVSGAEV